MTENQPVNKFLARRLLKDFVLRNDRANPGGNLTTQDQNKKKTTAMRWSHGRLFRNQPFAGLVFTFTLAAAFLRLFSARRRCFLITLLLC